MEKSGTNVSLAWQGIKGRNYSLEKSTNLVGSPSFFLLRSNLPSPSINGEQVVLSDNTATNGAALYRLKVGF
jgi:hypothetical protein